MMGKTIKPALTPEEWEQRFFRRPDVRYIGYNLDGSRYEARAFHMEAEVDTGNAAISVPASHWHGDDARRALAAIALKGQVTREMVSAVRECADSELAHTAVALLESLLPPD